MATRQTNHERFWLVAAPALGLLAVLGIIVGCTTGGSHKSSSPVAVNAMHVLRDNCLACHSEEKHKGGLRLSSRKGLLAGADVGPVVLAKNPEESRILKVLQADADPHMPPKKQLTPRQIGILRDWIRAGTPWDEAALRRDATHVEVKWRPLPASYQPVLALALSPDGSRLAVGRGSRLVIYDLSVTNFPVLSETNAHRDVVRSLAWSPDGRRLASGSHGGDWRLGAGGAQAASRKEDYAASIRAMREADSSPEGRCISLAPSP